MGEAPRWLSPPKLARMLGIEPPKVIGWIKRGELRALNVADKKNGRPRYRISPDALDEFMRPRETKSLAPNPVVRKANNGHKQKYYL